MKSISLSIRASVLYSQPVRHGVILIQYILSRMFRQTSVRNGFHDLSQLIIECAAAVFPLAHHSAHRGRLRPSALDRRRDWRLDPADRRVGPARQEVAVTLSDIAPDHAIHLLANVARQQDCRVEGLIRRAERSWVPTREGAVRRMSETGWLVDTDDLMEMPDPAH